MGKQQGMKLFFVLLFCTIFIYGFSHFGALAYNATTSTGDQFAEGTTIGALDVSGKSKSEAIALLIDQVTNWRTGTSIELQYKEKIVSVDLEIFNFEIDTTVNTAISGTNNPVIVSINQQDLRQAYKEISPDISIEDINEESFASELLTNARTLTAGTFKILLEKHVNSSSDKVQLIHQAEINLENTTLPVSDVVKGLSLIKIEPRTQVSLVKLFKEHGLVVTPEVMSVIASGIYEAILPSNFQIVERHIGLFLPTYIKLGYEAKVDEENKLDFVFANPNETIYEIGLTYDTNILTVQLLGSEFLYQYKLTNSEIETFKPKTIIQYSPLLKPNAKRVGQEGSDGKLIKLYREVYDEKGELLRTEFVSEDFYAPVHRIEVHGLLSGEASGDTTDGTDNSNGEGNETETDTNPTDSDNSDSETKDDLWGAPNEPK